jgi:hypothetical protein
MPWNALEDYRRLLPEYEQRTADYERRLSAYRQAQATDNADSPELQAVKRGLDDERAQLEDLFKRLEVIRKELAESAQLRQAVANS